MQISWGRLLIKVLRGVFFGFLLINILSTTLSSIKIDSFKKTTYSINESKNTFEYNIDGKRYTKDLGTRKYYTKLLARSNVLYVNPENRESVLFLAEIFYNGIIFVFILLINIMLWVLDND